MPEADVYDSDEDPTFMPPPIYETDYDFDEYSGEELEVRLTFTVGSKLRSVDKMVHHSGLKS